MEKMTGFTVNHLKLEPGVYVSEKKYLGAETVTTFDLRMTRPNFEPVMNTAEVQTIEHLGNAFLRNHEDWGSKVIHFGPMGCRTGFYLLLAGDLDSTDIIDLVREMFTYIAGFTGNVPGSSAMDCGNYLDMNLDMAKYLAEKYLDNTLKRMDEEHLVYPGLS